jgi:hypothetical protein
MSLVGITGIAMYAVQHFCFKYMVMYGIGSFWSHLCGIRTPGGPHQVSTRCTFRDMWREFDKGLHLFLKHCIYIPICSTRATWRVILGTFASFFTVYYWHGASESHRDWAMANCVGVLLEFIIYRVSKTRFIQRFSIFLFQICNINFQIAFISHGTDEYSAAVSSFRLVDSLKRYLLVQLRRCIPNNQPNLL